MSIGTHVSHCCAKHGCKYGDDQKCPVFSGTHKQEFPCETCSEYEFAIVLEHKHRRSVARDGERGDWGWADTKPAKAFYGYEAHKRAKKYAADKQVESDRDNRHCPERYEYVVHTEVEFDGRLDSRDVLAGEG